MQGKCSNSGGIPPGKCTPLQSEFFFSSSVSTSLSHLSSLLTDYLQGAKHLCHHVYISFNTAQQAISNTAGVNLPIV